MDIESTRQWTTIVEELDALGRTRTDAWQVPRVEGELLMQIALATGARTIVEIGTSYGFSGLFWGRACKLNGGHLHTIDIDAKKYQSARETFSRAGVGDVVTSYLGDAREVLASMPPPIDLLFIDADKPACRAYFELVWPKLRTGASVITDNAVTHRVELAEFIAYARACKDASSVEIAIGNGIEWTVKL